MELNYNLRQTSTPVDINLLHSYLKKNKKAEFKFCTSCFLISITVALLWIFASFTCINVTYFYNAEAINNWTPTECNISKEYVTNEYSESGYVYVEYQFNTTTYTVEMQTEYIEEIMDIKKTEVCLVNPDNPTEIIFEEYAEKQADSYSTGIFLSPVMNILMTLGLTTMVLFILTIFKLLLLKNETNLKSPDLLLESHQFTDDDHEEIQRVQEELLDRIETTGSKMSASTIEHAAKYIVMSQTLECSSNIIGDRRNSLSLNSDETPMGFIGDTPMGDDAIEQQVHVLDLHKYDFLKIKVIFTCCFIALFILIILGFLFFQIFYLCLGDSFFNRPIYYSYVITLMGFPFVVMMISFIWLLIFVANIRTRHYILTSNMLLIVTQDPTYWYSGLPFITRSKSLTDSDFNKPEDNKEERRSYSSEFKFRYKDDYTLGFDNFCVTFPNQISRSYFLDWISKYVKK
eukprot:TRINITY_DN1238_c1_g3_i1.p1 TRINITY_DN1238_c1_g3~~TRINITY_DN1238_c1_g3_i1.p1  ORF type:complete len:460 (+),score=86.91 TRINITY_DN1238_c1_g3_i1:116-1495(+)